MHNSELTATPPECTLLHLPSGKVLPCPLPEDFPLRFCLALGNFDGVHKAHTLLLRLAMQRAEDAAAQGHRIAAAAWCFRTPSGDYLRQDHAQHLTTTEEKLRLFAAMGLEYAFLADFPALRQLSPEAFTERILRQHCRAEMVCCGFHYRYGRSGEGTSATLSQAFADKCFVMPRHCIDKDGVVCRADADTADVRLISSSSIRRFLLEGDCRWAAAMLGRPYSLRAEVVRGKQLGRTLSFPTINQNFPVGKLVPRHGVYAVLCPIDGQPIIGVANVGAHPTVDAIDTPVNCETHLLDYHADLYGRTLTVYLLHHLRDERRFSDCEQLRAAIHADIDATRTLLGERDVHSLLLQLRHMNIED